MRHILSRRSTWLGLSALALAIGAPLACSSSSSSSGDTTTDGGGGGGDDGSISGDDGSSGDDGGAGGEGGGKEGGTDAGPDVIPEPPVVVHGYGRFTCGSHNGTLQCWGLNDFGNLGRGTSGAGANPVPAPVVGMTSVGSVFGLGYNHACALNGTTLSCWGENNTDQLGHDKALDLDAGEAGAPSLCFGNPCRTSPVAVSGVTDVAHIALSDSHTCVLGSGGTVTCWGSNQYGQIGADAGPLAPAPTPVGGLSNVVEIDLGGDSACARKQDGTVWCWGANYLGTLGSSIVDAGADASGADLGYHVAPVQVPGITGASEVAVGVYHACAIVGGNVSCWGFNNRGQLGHATALDPGCPNVGNECRAMPQQVAGISDAKELALGYEHSCALKNDETVWCWGSNANGELGHDPKVDGGAAVTSDPVPHQVTGLTGVAHIATGDTFSCAVQHDGTAYCWGINDRGQLGTNPGDGGPDGGALSSTFVPTKVNGL